MDPQVQAALANIAQMTGRQYPELRKALMELKGEAARDLLRLTRDLEDAVRRSARQAVMQPWRHW